MILAWASPLKQSFRTLDELKAELLCLNPIDFCLSSVVSNNYAACFYEIINIHYLLCLSRHLNLIRTICKHRF